MKNVTISMDEDLSEWVRIAAAREGKSLSRFIGDLLEQFRRNDPAYRAAMADFFSRGPADLGFNGRAPSRSELYDIDDVRGHEPLGVREGSQRPFEAGES